MALPRGFLPACRPSRFTSSSERSELPFSAVLGEVKYNPDPEASFRFVLRKKELNIKMVMVLKTRLPDGQGGGPGETCRQAGTVGILTFHNEKP